MNPTELAVSLEAALVARGSLLDARHTTAVRLFNGFAEGWSSLVVDLYARTLVLHDYGTTHEAESIATALQFYQERLPWLQAALLKQRSAKDPAARNGVLLMGQAADRKILESGVWYAMELALNQDAGFYLDTRNLRAWALANLGGKTVLNTFAYTGSLGVAALAGGATRVVQLDLNRNFLNVAKTSCTLNGFPIDRKDYVAADFWPAISRLNHDGARFDCVFLDPPFFAATSKGVVDVENNFARLINKVRPLISDGGTLIAINNGLYVSGANYLATLESLCADGYMTIEELIAVPSDCTGYTDTANAQHLTDPAPFNHSTKIAVLRVRRKVVPG
jgi:23S rRNA (cytosine1962-C5)-methyltransferase